MEGCTEFTNVTGNVTTTIFVKDNVVMGSRTIEIDGKYKIELWFNAAGKPHREGGLSAKIHYKDGKIVAQWWYKDGKLHHEGDLPAAIDYKDDKITGQYWYKYGKLHREGDLPAAIDYKDDKITGQRWYKDGVKQPEPKPVEPTADILARIRKDLARIRKDLAEIEVRMEKISQ